MAQHHFYREEARQRAGKAVREIEAGTAVQLVVALRPRAGDYRAADYLAGFGAALAVLAVLLYLPTPFSVASVPLDTLAGFAAGSLLCSRLPFLRRLLTPKRGLAEATHRAACAAFVDHGIARTRSRLGVLIFVGMLERCVEVLPDVGLDLAALGTEWTQSIEALRASLAPDPDVDAFVSALLSLGPPLQRVHPRGVGPVEELPDELEDADPAL